MIVSPTVMLAVPTAEAATPAPPAPTQLPATAPTEAASPSADVAPTVSPEPPSPDVATPTATADGCIDKAAFYDDVTIPDNTGFAQNTCFIKTWKIRNEGTCSWGRGYLLVFAGGSIMNGPQETALPAAQPGDIIDVSVPLVSPSGGGDYTGYWEFQNPAGKRFGVNSAGQDLIWVKIAVSWYEPTSPGQASQGDTSLPPASAGGSTTATPTAPTSVACAVERNPDYESTVLTLINNARQQNGLTPLKPQAQLAKAAAVHSTDMACGDFVDHTGSNGSTWYQRIAAQGYDYAYATENIYVGNPAFGGDAQGAFTWWMNSTIHRNNILDPKMVDIGIAYVFNAASTYGGYYTLNFSKLKLK